MLKIEHLFACPGRQEELAQSTNSIQASQISHLWVAISQHDGFALSLQHKFNTVLFAG
jgi:hypothetical protein